VEENECPVMIRGVRKWTEANTDSPLALDRVRPTWAAEASDSATYISVQRSATTPFNLTLTTRWQPRLRPTVKFVAGIQITAAIPISRWA